MALLVLIPGPSAVASDAFSGKFHGTGGLVLSSGSPQHMREFALGCSGCAWRFTSPCVIKLGVADRKCNVRDSSCSQNQLLRIWVLEPVDSWKDIGLGCVSREGPIFLRSLQGQAGKVLAESLPEMSLNCSPKSGVVTGLPFRCGSSQRQGFLAVRTAIFGFPIRVVLKPQRSWWVEQDGYVVSGQQGVSAGASHWRHVFANAGQFRVSHRVRWIATMHLPGSGEGVRLPDLVQSAQMGVAVGTVGSVLARGESQLRGQGADVQAALTSWHTTRTKARPSDHA